MGFLFTATMGKLFTMTLGIQLTVSNSINQVHAARKTCFLCQPIASSCGRQISCAGDQRFPRSAAPAASFFVRIPTIPIFPNNE
jgi:hypothetical protein